MTAVGLNWRFSFGGDYGGFEVAMFSFVGDYGGSAVTILSFGGDNSGLKVTSLTVGSVCAGDLKFWAVTTLVLKWRFKVWGGGYGGSEVAFLSFGGVSLFYA